MSEEKLKVPLQTLTNEEIESAQANHAQVMSLINNAPDGKVFETFTPVCTKHGNISKANYPLTYTKVCKLENGDVVLKPCSQVICKACVAEWYAEQIEKEVFGKIAVIPVYQWKEVVDQRKASAVLAQLKALKPEELTEEDKAKLPAEIEKAEEALKVANEALDKLKAEHPEEFKVEEKAPESTEAPSEEAKA